MHHDIIPLVAIVGAFATAISCTAIYYGYLAWRTMQATALKRDMVARGYTAREIIAVVNSSRAKDSLGEELIDDVPPAKPIKQPVFNP